MKQRIFFIFVLLLVSILFLRSSFAQDYTQIGLPKGAVARFGKGYINDIAYSPDGRILAVGWGEWANNRIQLLDPKILQPLDTLVGHTEDITDLSFSPDSGTLASASYDGTILLWKTGIEGGLANIPEDVNGDGSVNVDDLTFVAAHLGHVGEGNVADVNGDGTVNVLDLVKIAKAMERDLLPQ